jgi:hypothetical protein
MMQYYLLKENGNWKLVLPEEPEEVTENTIARTYNEMMESWSDPMTLAVLFGHNPYWNDPEQDTIEIARKFEGPFEGEPTPAETGSTR